MSLLSGCKSLRKSNTSWHSLQNASEILDGEKKKQIRKSSEKIASKSLNVRQMVAFKNLTKLIVEKVMFTKIRNLTTLFGLSLKGQCHEIFDAFVW